MTDAITNNTSNLYSGTTALSSKTLGSTDFLRLMTEQLKQQDPFEAHDNSQMIAQMAQITASSSTTEMSQTLKGIATQLGTQTDVLKQILANTTAAPAAATPAA
ncbi:MAG TPA: flagellar hook capping FlgD N-terminal domain-containing protein [Sphingomonas sp.]|jgi:flagellar basal-body rod modification protein FlgD|nr:flagellar hook capping FlgD N-terminal domain-containing protein [Sphingomonas sp.]